MAIGVKNKLNTINSVLGLLKFKHLNLYEKIRFGIFGLYTIFLLNPNKLLEGLDAETWLNKYAGKNVTKKIFYHLYSRNKFNIPLKRISAKQFANRLYEKEIQDFFTFPKESYQPIINNLKKDYEFLLRKLSRLKININNVKICPVKSFKKIEKETKKK